MVAKKHKSKRVSCAQRYKIQKKVKDHHKKVKKESNKGITNKRRRIEKNHIPNSFPYKEELLQEIQKQQKQKQQEEKNRLERFVENVQQRVEDFNQNHNNNKEEEEQEESQVVLKQKKLTRKSLLKVLQESDLVLSVVDVRDPLNSILSLNSVDSNGNRKKKKIVLVLNKCDLVPCDVAMEWLRYFRLNKNVYNLFNVVLCSCEKKIGMKELKAVIKSGCNSAVAVTTVVGVVGMPNVGKSALINSLIGLYSTPAAAGGGGGTRKDVVVSASKAGETKHLKRVRLEKNLHLLDSPGHCELVGKKKSSSIDHLLLGVINYEQYEMMGCDGANGDVVSVVQEVFTRLKDNVVILEKIYGLYAFRNHEEFLQMLARKSGKLRKGGVLDLRAAAIMVLKDWFQGKIPYYTRVPVESKSGIKEEQEEDSSAVIVSEYGQEFKWDCDAVELSGRSEGINQMDVEQCSKIVGMDDIVDYESDEEEEEDDDDQMDEDSDEEYSGEQKRFIGSNTNGSQVVQEGQYDFREYF